MKNSRKGMGIITIAISFYGCGSRTISTDTITNDLLNPAGNRNEDFDDILQDDKSKVIVALSSQKTQLADHHMEMDYDEEKHYDEK